MTKPAWGTTRCATPRAAKIFERRRADLGHAPQYAGVTEAELTFEGALSDFREAR